jgi:uncharacterized membrane protein YhhN
MADAQRTRAAPIAAVVAVLGGLLFIVGRWLDVYEVRLLSKGLPVLMMILLVRRGEPDRYSRWIAAGLVASLAGDLLLEWSADTFVAGVLAFLLAHVFYVAGFLRRAAQPRLLLALPFAVWGGLVFAELEPGLGAMRVPVAIYAVALSVMGWRAAALVGADTGREPWRTAIGAALFMLSDTLLALNKFGDPIAGAGYAVILLYWFGQLGIAASAWDPSRPRR